MSVFRGAAGGGGSKLTDAAGNPIDFSGSDVVRIDATAASVNATQVKTSAGSVEGLKARNTTAAAILVHLYDDAGADGDPADDALRDVFELPPGAISAWSIPGGLKCGTGIGFKITAADGVSAVAAGALTRFALYFR